MWHRVHNQPPEVFYKKTFLKNFSNIQRETPELEYLFHKATELKACKFLKKRLQLRCFPLNIVKFFKKTYSEEYLWAAAFESP